MKNLELEYPIGKIIGDFTVINHYRRYYKSGSKLILVCKCNIKDCNNIRDISASDIKNHPRIVEHRNCNRHTYNGLATGEYCRFYKIWYDMVNRCCNPNCKSFLQYGARGITCDYTDDKKGYLGFLKEQYDSYKLHVDIYGEKNTTIDRIDYTKGYYYENIRWATYKEQIQNRMNMDYFIAVDKDGIFYVSNNQSKFSIEFNVPRNAIYLCINNMCTQYNGWHFLN